jgi:hypothetical protein
VCVCILSPITVFTGSSPAIFYFKNILLWIRNMYVVQKQRYCDELLDKGGERRGGGGKDGSEVGSTTTVLYVTRIYASMYETDKQENRLWMCTLCEILVHRSKML